jgi:hypothetical protein
VVKIPTPYSDIFKKANILFEDSKLLSDLTDEEYSELLELFLSKAKSVYFKKCRKNLNDTDETLKQFNQELDLQEQWIISECLRYIWVERQVFKEEKLRERLSTKDYERKSPANLLDKLITLKREAKTSLDNMISSYTFDNFKGFD